MAYNTQSSYSSESNTIDDLVFVSDVNLSHKRVMETHQNYIENGQYSTASTYINEQTGITPIVADLFNLIKNRIIALQTYLLSLDQIERANYENEPLNPTDGMIWIE